MRFINAEASEMFFLPDRIDPVDDSVHLRQVVRLSLIRRASSLRS